VHEAGLPFDQVIDALKEARRRDFSYAEGQILGSMCTAPHPVALEAFRLFHETNLGDPGHFPGTRALESEYMDWLLSLTHAPPGARGLFVSGGTEANILAVYAARERWRKIHGDRDRRLNIIVPAAAHFSFEKARRLTDMELRYAEVDAGHRVRPDAVAALMDDATALVVGIAGTTEIGALDPIIALADLAHHRGVAFHVDAALGGFLLPFLEQAGHAPTQWDFSLEGVTSIAMDPHKMGASLIPGGIFLARDAGLLDEIAVETPYVTTGHQSGLLGTRPGAGAAAAWAVARHLGKEGYGRIVRRALEVTRLLRDRLDAGGLNYETGGLNVLLVHTRDPMAVQAELGRRGFRVNAVPRLRGIRIVAMPHVEWTHLEAFLPHLLEVVRKYPPSPVQEVS
jgi:tyrosine decarboxylase / aspartate 1-decarboxylase